MGRKLVRVISFLALFCVLFYALEIGCYDTSSVSGIWAEVANEEAGPYDILFMGNSHLYCSLNPLVLNESLGIHTAILGSSAQFMEMTLENLKVVLKYQIPKVIILETFTAAIGDQTTSLTKKVGHIYNNFDGIKNIWMKAKAVTHVLHLEDIPGGIFQLLRPTQRWKRWEILLNGSQESRRNIYGYELRSKVAEQLEYSVRQVDAFWKNESMRAAALPDNQEEMLRKFFELTGEYGIPVYLVTMPVMDEYEDLASRLKTIESIAAEYDHYVGSVNYAGSMAEMGITEKDFYDSTHLNQRGASKLTQYVTREIGRAMGKEPDFDRVSFYKDESVVPLDGDLWRYTVECYGDMQYQFVYKIDGGRNQTTEYSDRNYVDLPKLSETDKLWVRILPKGVDPGSEEGRKARWQITLLKQ